MSILCVVVGFVYVVVVGVGSVDVGFGCVGFLFYPPLFFLVFVVRIPRTKCALRFEIRPAVIRIR